MHGLLRRSQKATLPSEGIGKKPERPGGHPTGYWELGIAKDPKIRFQNTRRMVTYSSCFERGHRPEAKGSQRDRIATRKNGVEVADKSGR